MPVDAAFTAVVRLQALADEELSSTSAGQLLLALARYGTAPVRSVTALINVVCPSPADEAAGAETDASGDADVSPAEEPARRTRRPPTLDALVNAAWAAGVLKVASTPEAERLCAAAAAALDAAVATADAGGRSVPERVLRKAYHAQMMLRLRGGDLPLGAAAASTAAAAWAAETWPQGHAQLVQSRLVRFLEAMRVPFKANVPVDDGRLRVGVAVEQSKGEVRPRWFARPTALCRSRTPGSHFHHRTTSPLTPTVCPSSTSTPVTLPRGTCRTCTSSAQHGPARCR